MEVAFSHITHMVENALHIFIGAKCLFDHFPIAISKFTDPLVTAPPMLQHCIIVIGAYITHFVATFKILHDFNPGEWREWS
jgi:hypothetical protein